MIQTETTNTQTYTHRANKIESAKMKFINKQELLRKKEEYYQKKKHENLRLLLNN